MNLPQAENITMIFFKCPVYSMVERIVGFHKHLWDFRIKYALGFRECMALFVLKLHGGLILCPRYELVYSITIRPWT